LDVSCAQRDKDRYGRIVAVCHASAVNLNAVMVQSGLALAYRKYCDNYSKATERSDGILLLMLLRMAPTCRHLGAIH
jgi:endonuclease YncB( thermonuclease family)